jgi:Zn-dependent peptidase ImmA (M78 family)
MYNREEQIMEYEANEFAGCILMPEDLVRDQYLKYDTTRDLAKKF